jgi:hypothetical protein
MERLALAFIKQIVRQRARVSDEQPVPVAVTSERRQ